MWMIESKRQEKMSNDMTKKKIALKFIQNAPFELRISESRHHFN